MRKSVIVVGDGMELELVDYQRLVENKGSVTIRKTYTTQAGIRVLVDIILPQEQEATNDGRIDNIE